MCGFFANIPMKASRSWGLLKMGVAGRESYHLQRDDSALGPAYSSVPNPVVAVLMLWTSSIMMSALDSDPDLVVQ